MMEPEDLTSEDLTPYENGAESRNPLERLAESFVSRYRRGENPEISEYTEKHPELADEIRSLFSTLMMVENLGDKDGKAPSDRTAPASGTPMNRLGEYVILRELGRGGMGIVYEAEQESLGRRVALKILPQHALLDEKQKTRFFREARAAASLHHSNIVSVFGVGEEEGVPYFAMQFIAGESLEEVIRELAAIQVDAQIVETPAPEELTVAQKLRSGEFDSASHRDEQSTSRGENATPKYIDASAKKKASSSSIFLGSDSALGKTISSRGHYYRSVARVGVQVADALAHAHGEGIVHRDIKPSNLILDTGGTVWVADFGLAKAEGTATLTQKGDVVGTLAYMAPERLDGWCDSRSDVYGLGLTIYELLTLKRAFDESDRHRLLRAITDKLPTRPRKIDCRIPPDLETITLRAMEKDPARRYATAEQFRDDLQRFIDGKPIHARRSGVVEQGRLWCRRNRLVASSLALLAATVLVATMITLFAAERQRAAERAQNVAEYRPRIFRALEKIQFRQLSVKSRYLPEWIYTGGWVRETDVAITSGEGRDLLSEGIQELQAIARSVPQRPEAWFYRARALVLEGRRDEVALNLESALAAEPGFPPALHLRRALEEGESDGRGSTEEFHASIDSWGSVWSRAHDALEESRWHDAEEAFDELLRTASSVDEPYVGSAFEWFLERGVSRIGSRDFNGAIEDFAAAEGQWTRALVPALLIGKAYHLKGEEQIAERKFEEVYHRAKLQDEVALGVACLYFWVLMDKERSLAWCEKIRNTVLRERNRAQVLHSLGRQSQAMESALKALAIDPDDDLARFYLGCVYRRLGETEKAIAEYSKVIELSGGYYEVRWLLAKCLRDHGDIDDAVKLICTTIEKHPQKEAPYLELLEILRRHHIQGVSEMLRITINRVEDRPATLISHREVGGATRVHTKDHLPLLYQALCLAYMEEGKLQEIISLLERISKDAGKSSPELWGMVGMAHEWKGYLNQAILYYRKAIELGTRDGRVYSGVIRALRSREAASDVGPLQLLEREKIPLPTLPNPRFEGSDGRKDSPGISGVVPDGFRVYVVAGGSIELLRIAENEVYPGSPQANSVRLTARSFGKEIHFSHRDHPIPMISGLWYRIEFYVRSSNSDEKGQSFSGWFSLLREGEIVYDSAGSLRDYTAGEVWKRFTGPWLSADRAKSGFLHWEIRAGSISIAFPSIRMSDVPPPPEAPNPQFSGDRGGGGGSASGTIPDGWYAHGEKGEFDVQVLPVGADELYPGSAATRAVRLQARVIGDDQYADFHHAGHRTPLIQGAWYQIECYMRSGADNFDEQAIWFSFNRFKTGDAEVSWGARLSEVNWNSRHGRAGVVTLTKEWRRVTGLWFLNDDADGGFLYWKFEHGSGSSCVEIALPTIRTCDVPPSPELTNPHFLGSAGQGPEGEVSGEIPDGWHAFAPGGRVEVEVVPIGENQLFPGSLSTNAVLLRAVKFGTNQFFDNAIQRVVLTDDVWYRAGCYVRSANRDGSDQKLSFYFPLFQFGKYLGHPYHKARGSVGQLVATREWRYISGPCFRNDGADRGEVAWQLIDDGGEDNAILIALPGIEIPVHPAGVSCSLLESGVVILSWSNLAEYESIQVSRDGEVLASIDPGSTSYIDEKPAPGEHSYEIGALVREDFGGESCELRVPAR